MAADQFHVPREKQAWDQQPHLLPPLRKQNHVFLHPGYVDPKIFLKLTGFDSPDGGLHHETARVACAIVANNRFDGYLSETPDGTSLSLNLGPDAVLMKRRYYFIVPGFATSPPSSKDDLQPYPIVRSLADWVFPHDRLPKTWKDLPDAEVKGRKTNATEWARHYHGACCMTGFDDGLEVAHICPRSRQQWCERNRMIQYTGNSPGSAKPLTNDKSNLMLLRADLHYAFAQSVFVAIPKYGALCAHLLAPNTRPYERLFHNLKLLQNTWGREFLFTRFAWSIFRSIGPNSGLRSRMSGTLVVIGNGAPFTQMIPPKRGRRSESSSPSRRKRDGSRSSPEDETDHDEDDDRTLEGQEEKQDSELTKVGIRNGDARSSSSASVSIASSPSPLHDNASASAMPTSEPLRAGSRASDHDADGIAALRANALAKERAQSDPNGHFQKMSEWATSVLENGGRFEHPCPETYADFFWAMGLDSMEMEE